MSLSRALLARAAVLHQHQRDGCAGGIERAHCHGRCISGARRLTQPCGWARFTAACARASVRACCACVRVCVCVSLCLCVCVCVKVCILTMALRRAEQGYNWLCCKSLLTHRARPVLEVSMCVCECLRHYVCVCVHSLRLDHHCGSRLDTTWTDLKALQQSVLHSPAPLLMAPNWWRVRTLSSWQAT